MSLCIFCLFVCIIVFTDCQTPPVLTDATADYNSTSQGSSVVYTCNTGYEYQSGNTSLECTVGVWTGTLLTCSLSGRFDRMVIIA